MDSVDHQYAVSPTSVATRMRLAALAAAAVLGFGGTPTFAADQAAAGGQSASSSDNALQEIVVTAEFRKEKLQETPLAITALSGSALTSRNVTNLVDVTNVAPNVTMFQANAAYGKTNAASIRGIGQGDFNFASAEPGVGMYIDDVYFATTFGSLFDLLDVDRIEVLRGPQGTLFGKNSIGGAIRIISKKPQGDDSGSVSLTTGNFGRRELRGMMDVSLIKDVLMLRITGMSKTRRGYVNRIDYACAHPSTAGTLPVQSLGQGNNCNLGTEGGLDVHGVRAQLRWVPSDNFEDNFSAEVMDDNSEAAAEVMLVADPSLRSNPNVPSALETFNTNVLIPKYGIPYDSRFVTAGTYNTYSTFYDPNLGISYPAKNTVHNWAFSNTADWKITDAARLKSITAYQGYWGDFSDDQDNSPMGIAWAYNLLDHHQFSQEFQLTGKAFSDRLDWATGVFYFDGFSMNRGHVGLDFFGSFPPAQFLPPFLAPWANQFVLNFNDNDPARTKDKAIFAQTTFAFTDQFHLTTGVRYTKEDKNYTYNHFNPLIPVPSPVLDLRGVEGKTSYSHVDWKAGLDYEWTPNVMTYASVTTGFRGGGLNPRPFDNAQITTFGPEKTTSFEIGEKSEWFDHRLRANLAVYLSRYRDVVINSQRLDNQGIPFTGPQNVGAADIKGFELELEAHPVGALELTANVGLTDFKWKNLGTSVGCQDLGSAAIPTVNCLPGNPGSGDIIPGTSKWQADVGGQYTFNLAGGSSLVPRLDYHYQTKRYNNYYNLYNGGNGGPVAFTPSLGLLSGRITWMDAAKKWSVALFGTNLTDKYYYQSFLDLRAFGEGQLSAQPARPREWGVTFTRNF